MIDPATIDDVKELKVMAYDDMAQMQRLQHHLELLNRRIAELLSEQPKA